MAYMLFYYVRRISDYIGFQATKPDNIKYNQNQVHGIIKVIVGLYPCYFIITINEDKQCDIFMQ